MVAILIEGDITFVEDEDSLREMSNPDRYALPGQLPKLHNI